MDGVQSKRLLILGSGDSNGETTTSIVLSIIRVIVRGETTLPDFDIKHKSLFDTILSLYSPQT